jgi:hypothetical protein
MPDSETFIPELWTLPLPPQFHELKMIAINDGIELPTSRVDYAIERSSPTSQDGWIEEVGRGGYEGLDKRVPRAGNL